MMVQQALPLFSKKRKMHGAYQSWRLFILRRLCLAVSQFPFLMLKINRSLKTLTLFTSRLLFPCVLHRGIYSYMFKALWLYGLWSKKTRVDTFYTVMTTTATTVLKTPCTMLGICLWISSGWGIWAAHTEGAVFWQDNQNIMSASEFQTTPI